MHCLHGVEEEKGFLGCALGMVLQILQAFLKEDHIDFLQVKIWGDHAWAIVARVGVLG